MTQQERVPDNAVEAQDTFTAETLATVMRVLESFNRHDLDAVMAAMTDDCVWESAFPLPDGTPYEGQAAVRSYLQEVFRSRSDAVSEPEEMFAAGDRCTVRLVRRWTGEDGRPHHFRGMGAFRVRDGKVAEYLVYHKRNRGTGEGEYTFTSDSLFEILNAFNAMK